MELTLTKGYVAIVDDADSPRVASFKWTAQVDGENAYAYRQANGVKIYLHRAVLGLGPGRTPQVDHIDMNGLNNRRANLRLATPTQNNANHGVRRQRAKTSIYKGVSWDRQKQRWLACVQRSGRRHQRFFVDEVAAARAYDAMATALFGEFARTNAYEARTAGDH